MRSMTAYASQSREITVDKSAPDSALLLSFEIKALNSKFFELNVSLPPLFSSYEMRLRAMISERMKRGKISCRATVVSGKAPVDARLNEAVFEELKEAFLSMGVAEPGEIVKSVPFETLFTLSVREADEDSAAEFFRLVDDTISVADAMRLREGAATKEDLLRIYSELELSLNGIEARFKEAADEHYERLVESLKELLGDYKIDENRIMLEAGITANKLNVNEEIKRLRSHLEQYKELLNSEGEHSKRLDFLSQELLRETNTIASKVQDIEIVRFTLDMKSAIDQLKEQARNLV